VFSVFLSAGIAERFRDAKHITIERFSQCGRPEKPTEETPILGCKQVFPRQAAPGEGLLQIIFPSAGHTSRHTYAVSARNAARIRLRERLGKVGNETAGF